MKSSDDNGGNSFTLGAVQWENDHWASTTLMPKRRYGMHLAQVQASFLIDTQAPLT